MLNLNNNDIQHLVAGANSLKEGINTSLELNDFNGQRESKEIAKRTIEYLDMLSARLEKQYGATKIGLTPVAKICGRNLTKDAIIGISSDSSIHEGYLEFNHEHGVFFKHLDGIPDHNVSLVIRKRDFFNLPLLSQIPKDIEKAKPNRAIVSSGNLFEQYQTA